MIRPLNDNVLIKKETIENKTASGIILSAKENTEDNIGVVIAVGEGSLVDGKRVPMTVKVNDKVIFDKYAGKEVEYQGEKYLLVSESKIYAVID
ncbi:MAG: co-chaperone GroES [Erysipelotrichaceae bacterium]|nr:co-chaperone GroES [Erysipelotrichaceae bacterium]